MLLFQPFLPDNATQAITDHALTPSLFLGDLTDVAGETLGTQIRRITSYLFHLDAHPRETAGLLFDYGYNFKRNITHDRGRLITTDQIFPQPLLNHARIKSNQSCQVWYRRVPNCLRRHDRYCERGSVIDYDASLPIIHDTTTGHQRLHSDPVVLGLFG